MVQRFDEPPLDQGPSSTTLLDIRSLEVTFDSNEGPIQAVRGVSVSVEPGEVVGIVGESGSGKSVTMLAALGLLPATASVSGSVRFQGEELLGLPDDELRKFRGRRIGMIFQDPLTSLNPVLTIGQQIGGAIAAHHGRQRSSTLRDRAMELLDLVSIPEPRRRVDSYPHELSGGMRQRAMIALAMANEPEVLIADEPTTALDVTIQAQILDVLRAVQKERGLGIVLITHDLGVVAGMADRVAVMYGGRVVENGTVDDVFASSRHPYTSGLIGGLPRLDRRDIAIAPIPGSPPSPSDIPSGCAFHPRCPIAIEICSSVDPALDVAGPVASACHRRDDLSDPAVNAVLKGSTRYSEGADETEGDRTVPEAADGPPILHVDKLETHFDLRSTGLFRRVVGKIEAVAGVSFDLRPGEVLGLVGESGCGKSTTGRSILRLIEPDSGTVTFDGEDVLSKTSSEMRALRANLQIVFQDPYSSLNSRMRVGEIIAEPLIVHGMSPSEASARVAAMLELVQLRPEFVSRFPHQFSGGQRQRISLARSLALEPDVLVLDEPVSALDVSVQAGIIELLNELRTRLNLAIVFIAHDLSVVRHISDVVAIMYLGRIVEVGPNDDVFTRPSHPYTQALLSAVPIPDPIIERTRTPILLQGDVPSGINPPSGCRFRTRCWKAEDRCAHEQPELVDRGGGHPVACHLPG
ncbi:MAG: ABC transporter ATP-binding protein [Actinomycetota bacterium]|nr:ABC transporter ATP-binding protein [Actinomycetota bacterium]